MSILETVVSHTTFTIVFLNFVFNIYAYYKNSIRFSEIINYAETVQLRRGRPAVAVFNKAI